MEAVLKIIARENLLLGTGHLHPEEIIAVVKRGRELGVKNIIVTHGLTNVPGLTMVTRTRRRCAWRRDPATARRLGDDTGARFGE